MVEIYKARLKGNIRHGKLSFSQAKLGFFDAADVLVFCNGNTGNFAKAQVHVDTVDEKMGTYILTAVFLHAVFMAIHINIM